MFEAYLESIGEHGLCAVDERLPADGENLDGDKLSRLACDQIRIGSLLTRKNRLLVTRSRLDGPAVDSLDTDVFGYRIGLTDDEEAAGRFGEDAATGNLLRVWDFSLPEDADKPLFHGHARRDVNAWAPRFDEADLAEISRYEDVPLDDSEIFDIGDIKPFGQLACEARAKRNSDHGSGSDPEPWVGVSALMTLKGDVDNLGAIFQRGLEAPSLSRTAALSRQMNAFFAVYLPYLCRTEFRHTYTVFAGGDDFFLIGPWTQQMDLASRLRDDFGRYVAGNARIGFSAGLAMRKPGLPVRRFEAMAEVSLEDSKAFRRECGGSKNAVTCFERTMDWTDYGELLEARERLHRLVSEMRLSQGYIYGLLKLVEMKESVPYHPENARWRSRFCYQTSRSLEKARGLEEDERRRRMEALAQEIVQGGIERFGGNYRTALFGHLYRNRR